MIMCIVSPVAFGPTMRSTDFTLPMKGVFGPKVFIGRPISSSSRGTSERLTVEAAARTAERTEVLDAGLVANEACGKRKE